MSHLSHVHYDRYFQLTINSSSGQTGPVSRFLNDPSAPEHKDAGTLGRALFDNESFESWSSLYNVNTFPIFFVTTAFLGLLATGSEDRPGYTSSVINITSISGIMKLAQNHVCLYQAIVPCACRAYACEMASLRTIAAKPPHRI
jgi:NAD(P)-dependent dehydrogenase (short-subunit alcohol dehydrogenase family)